MASSSSLRRSSKGSNLHRSSKGSNKTKVQAIGEITSKIGIKIQDVGRIPISPRGKSGINPRAKEANSNQKSNNTSLVEANSKNTEGEGDSPKVIEENLTSSREEATPEEEVEVAAREGVVREAVVAIAEEEVIVEEAVVAVATGTTIRKKGTTRIRLIRRSTLWKARMLKITTPLKLRPSQPRNETLMTKTITEKRVSPPIEGPTEEAEVAGAEARDEVGSTIRRT